MQNRTAPFVWVAALFLTLACAGEAAVQSQPATGSQEKATAPAKEAKAVLPVEALFSSFPRVQGPQSDHLRFLAVGDTGELPQAKRSNYLETLEAMRAVSNGDALLLLGDNVYGCGLRNMEDPGWQRQIEPLLSLGLPTYPVLGSHDYGERAHPKCAFSNPEVQTKRSGKAGYERWIFPERSYVVETPLAELIFFDSSPIAYQWDEAKDIVAGLEEALARPKKTPWRIVVAHHPLRSCGQHGEQSKTIAVRSAVEPLLDTVDLYLAGHDHGLEIQPRTEGRPLYVISGGGSRVRGRTICTHDDFKIQSGFFTLDLTPETLTVQAHCNGQKKPCISEVLKVAAEAPPDLPN